MKIVVTPRGITLLGLSRPHGLVARAPATKDQLGFGPFCKLLVVVIVGPRVEFVVSYSHLLVT